MEARAASLSDPASGTGAADADAVTAVDEIVLLATRAAYRHCRAGPPKHTLERSDIFCCRAANQNELMAMKAKLIGRLNNDYCIIVHRRTPQE